MKESKYTSGPWSHYHGKLRPQFPNLIHEVQDKSGGAIVNWQGFDGLGLPKKQVAANAALIAAAPELLEVLESALRQSNCPGENCAINWHTQARVIIAKAKGE